MRRRLVGPTGRRRRRGVRRGRPARRPRPADADLLVRFAAVADGVFVRRHESLDLNCGLVVGDGACLVVDTRSDLGEAADLVAAVRRVTPHPWTVVNTHAHYDHCARARGVPARDDLGPPRLRRRPAGGRGGAAGGAGGRAAGGGPRGRRRAGAARPARPARCPGGRHRGARRRWPGRGAAVPRPRAHLARPGGGGRDGRGRQRPRRGGRAPVVRGLLPHRVAGDAGSAARPGPRVGRPRARRRRRRDVRGVPAGGADGGAGRRPVGPVQGPAPERARGGEDGVLLQVTRRTTGSGSTRSSAEIGRHGSPGT
ncbi:hypothetical protein E4P41_13970 [Geodermatophilus sp. DF01-2]|nr:hypothetical protein E4P41_13970 [Geodermatophilus sp. DF01_2]